MKRSPYGHRVGEWHHRSKYPDSLIQEIRDKYIAYVYGYKRLSKEYGIPEHTIRDWVTYRTRYDI